MLFALTRDISPALERCELTHLPRAPIDLPRARAQHDAFEWALVELGCTVRRLHSAPDLPDSVFVEDTAIVLHDAVIVARPGAASRRAETPAVAAALGRFELPLYAITAPATVDGGDVLVVGRRVFVGSSTRTNAAGIAQLRRILKRHGYDVRVVQLRGCLHLKSAATAVAADTVLLNPAWVSRDVFAGFSQIEVADEEPHAGNALRIASDGTGTVIYPAAFVATRGRLERHGIRVRPVETDELAKAEGGVTCCALIVDL